MVENLIEKLLDGAEEILGLPRDEMETSLDLDLFDNGLIDSLGCVSLMNYMEDALNKKIDVAKMNPEDFTSINTMAAAIAGMLKL